MAKRRFCAISRSADSNLKDVDNDGYFFPERGFIEPSLKRHRSTSNYQSHFSDTCRSSITSPRPFRHTSPEREVKHQNGSISDQHSNVIIGINTDDGGALDTEVEVVYGHSSKWGYGEGHLSSAGLVQGTTASSNIRALNSCGIKEDYLFCGLVGLVFKNNKLIIQLPTSNENRGLFERLEFLKRGPENISLREDRIDDLDPDYQPRSSGFFTVGRVFATLLVEPDDRTDKSVQSINSDSGKVSSGILGQNVYSHIMQFVVVHEREGFCYACPIQIYNGKGTSKIGCDPNEHAIIYMKGDEPTLNGEKELEKGPIEVIPASHESRSGANPLSKSSRIRFERIQAIKHNVKAKEIGYVRDQDLDRIKRYWTEEIQMSPKESFEARQDSPISANIGKRSKMNGKNEEGAAVSAVNDSDGRNSTTTATAEMSDSSAGDGSSPSQSVKSTNDFHTGSVIKSEVPGNLHSAYVQIEKPRNFFKKGRVIMVLWPEPTGLAGTQFYVKIRRFVVIRPRSTYCLCLPISTYNGRATTKPGVTVRNHAAVIPAGGEVKLHPEGERLNKDPIEIIVEDQSISIDPMSRMNFGKVYVLEHNVEVRNVGRIAPSSIKLMEDYFATTMK